jgi:hypothetical protein
MKLTFQLGFALICIGIAIAAGVNYLDMRQFEARLDGFVSTSPASDASGICRSLKTEDGFSKKYISPELSQTLLDDFSRTDHYVKSSFQNIRDSVSQKKSQALHSMFMFLIFAFSMGLVHYSVILKAKAQSAKRG